MRSNRKRKYALKKDPVGKKNEGLEKKNEFQSRDEVAGKRHRIEFIPKSAQSRPQRRQNKFKT